MPSKYGFETDDERQKREIEQLDIKQQRKNSQLKIIKTIDPIIRDIFADYLALVKFKETLGYDVEIRSVYIVLHEEFSEGQWGINFQNKNQVEADPYNWGEINPWTQSFYISVDLQLDDYDKPQICIRGAFYTLYGIKDTGSYRKESKGYDVAELPQREILEQQISLHTGIEVRKWKH